MPWWLLLLFIFFVWCLWAVAAAAQLAVEDARRPLPNGARRNLSVVPVLPVYPLILWGVAVLLNTVWDQCGTILVGCLHALFAMVLVVSIARDWWRLRTGVAFDRGAAPDPRD